MSEQEKTSPVGRVGESIRVHALERFRAYASASSEAPALASSLDSVLYGLAQPVLAIRLLRRDEDLLRRAFQPVLMLAAFCLFVAWIDEGDDLLSFVADFYKVFAALAPVPPVIFFPHYARLAAESRKRLGFGHCEPLYRSLSRRLFEAAAQAIIVAVAVAPVLLVLGLLPTVGRAVAWIVAGLWALHWIVVEAFDNARTLRKGETAESVDLEVAGAPDPWFVRFFRRLAGWHPKGLRWIAHRFAGFCERLSAPWREETAMVEKHPWVVFGFSLSTALLLAIPGLNLFFRPIIIVASVHVLGQLERQAAARPPESP